VASKWARPVGASLAHNELRAGPGGRRRRGGAPLLSTALGGDGYEVLAAEGGNAALARLAAGGVDAVVLDVAMPEPNGLEVCRRLRARGDRTPIPIWG
jgi:DNA-binding NtrC family response regulator